MRPWVGYAVVGGAALVVGIVAGRFFRNSGPAPSLQANCDAGVTTLATVSCDAGPPPTATCKDTVTIRYVDRIIMLPGDAGVIDCPTPVVTETHESNATGGSPSAFANASGEAAAGASVVLKPSGCPGVPHWGIGALGAVDRAGMGIGAEVVWQPLPWLELQAGMTTGPRGQGAVVVRF